MVSTRSPLPYSIASSMSLAYCGILAALKMSDGLVVASCGFKRLIASTSPVSATTMVCALSCSNWFVMVISYLIVDVAMFRSVVL